MRWAWWSLVVLVACKGGGSGGGVDASGDDDDDGSGGGSAVHSTVPWSEVEDSQAVCCSTVKEQFEWTEVLLSDTDYFLYVMPEDPIGAIIVSHGSGGDIGTVRQPEWVELYNLLVPRGVGLMMRNSLDRQVKQWSLEPDGSNEDIDRIEEMIGIVANETDFDVNDPIVTLGFSNGASFAVLLADSLQARGRDVKGASMHQGGYGLLDGIPMLWTSAENDTAGGGPSAMARNAENGGPPSAHFAGTEVPLDPYRFAKAGLWDEAQSQGIFDLMVEDGWVDAQGQRLIDWGDDPTGWCDRNENRLPSPQSPSTAMSQLRVVWATHRFSAQHKFEEAAWIEERLLE